MQATPNPAIIPASVTSFYDYFTLNAETGEVAQALGYSYTVGSLVLPKSRELPAWSQDLDELLRDHILLVRMGNETVRREAIIAPIVLRIIRALRLPINMEYWVNVAPQLKGRLDYLMRSDESLLVVEAKDGDITRGTTQLVAEMIALDQWENTNDRTIWGAITSGTLWYFAILNRREKIITQDLLQGFQVPADLGNLLQTLLGILESDPINDASI